MLSLWTVQYNDNRNNIILNIIDMNILQQSFCRFLQGVHVLFVIHIYLRKRLFPQHCLPVTRRVPLVEQELLTLQFSWGLFCSIFCFLCSVLKIIACLYVPFLYATVVCVSLRLTASGIFNTFLIERRQLLFTNQSKT